VFLFLNNDSVGCNVTISDVIDRLSIAPLID